MRTATVTINSVRIEDCPVLDGTARAEFRAAAKAANAFSGATLTWLGRKDADEQAAWLKTCVTLSREMFQPWTIKILFLLSVLGPVRFGELEDTLGVSSRTLSDRLKLLKQAGLIERTVHDEHPVRVEYTPTAAGRKTAALAAPFIAHLVLEALKAAGRL
jgi:DNA-binding HxlR family transcriptional regulator